MDALLRSINAGVGSLVAEGDKERIKKVFLELTSLRLWLASVVCFGIYKLGHSFIILWVGNDFLLEQSAFIVLIAITFIGLSRTNDTFLAAYGLFQDVWVDGHFVRCSYQSAGYCLYLETAFSVQMRI